MATLQKKAKGQRPAYFEDPAVEKVLAITLALAGEVAVLRDRLDTHERLSALGRPFGSAEVDGYMPDAATREERDRRREAFLDVVLRCVHQEVEGMEAKAGNYDAAIAEVRAPAAASAAVS